LSRLSGSGRGGRLGGGRRGGSGGRGLLGLPHHQDEEVGGLDVEGVDLGIIRENLSSEDELLPSDVLAAQFLDLLFHIQYLTMEQVIKI
jgi:hypothetical protein